MVTQFFDLIDYSDHWGLLIPTGLLLYLGHHVCRHHERLRKYGIGVGLLAFLVLLLRFAMTTGLDHSDFLFDAVVGSALGASLVGSIVWLAAPIVEQCYHWLYRLRAQYVDWREDSKPSVPVARPVIRPDPAETEAWEVADLAEKQRQAEQAEAQRRREEARVGVALKYQQYAPELRERFMREQLDEFTSQYMTDEHTAEQVEQRSHQLRQLIEEWAGQRQTSANSTIDEVVAWHQEMRDKVSHLDVDSRIIDFQLSNLDATLTELLQKCLEKPQQ